MKGIGNAVIAVMLMGIVKAESALAQVTILQEYQKIPKVAGTIGVLGKDLFGQVPVVKLGQNASNDKWRIGLCAC